MFNAHIKWLMVLIPLVLALHFYMALPKQIQVPQLISTPTFQLKHVFNHGTGANHEFHQMLDITPEWVSEYASAFDASALDEWTSISKFSTQNPLTVELPFKFEHGTAMQMSDNSPEFVESYLDHVRKTPEDVFKISLDWKENSIVIPNVTDKETILTMALMSSNAYVRVPFTGDWRNVTFPKWNHSTSAIGWEKNGLRGHIFASHDEDVVVIALKGTSAAGLGGSGEEDTVELDKTNDNLLFSCCCARVSYLWKTVCDCFTKSYTCDQTCLEKELYRKDMYYAAAMDIYKNVTSLYPKATIWTTGHSLGGSMASLLARTYGLPCVAFEAPGEMLATKRLHLPLPPGLPSHMEHIYHFGHTADPIFMGTCNGASSTCSVAGYAMETKCHSGKICVYDVVKDKGWHENMLNHRIHTVIDGVLEAYDDVAECEIAPPCHDCYNWNFVRPEKEKSSSKEETTSAKSSTKDVTFSSFTTRTKSKTRQDSTTTMKIPEVTSTCIGRNWFGYCTEYSTFTQMDSPKTQMATQY